VERCRSNYRRKIPRRFELQNLLPYILVLEEKETSNEMNKAQGRRRLYRAIFAGGPHKAPPKEPACM
jgi:hypothetical protein